MLGDARRCSELLGTARGCFLVPLAGQVSYRCTRQKQNFLNGKVKLESEISIEQLIEKVYIYATEFKFKFKFKHILVTTTSTNLNAVACLQVI